MVVAFLVAIGSPPPRPKVELCDGVFTGFAGSLVIPANGMFSALANSASILAFFFLVHVLCFLRLLICATTQLCNHIVAHTCVLVTAQLLNYVVV